MLNFMTVLQQLCAKVKVEKVKKNLIIVYAMGGSVHCFCHHSYMYVDRFVYTLHTMHFTNFTSYFPRRCVH